uniref:Aminoacyl-tRNA synthetase class II (G/ P/ S/T) domain-containing protein n=1 Tax=Trichobilharzia regenti TaxID=157069 RepID=A0AA85KGF0_TRIRE|nr:unnamed protein product [Trichobilharzia regenti]
MKNQLLIGCFSKINLQGFAHFIVSGTPFQFVVISQITSKFRDEPHPKNGLVRGREFLMQDLYTFDTCAETAKETYSHVQAAYMKLLDNLELPYLVARADSGHVGGEFSDEFHIVSSVGEDKILVCPKCSAAFNAELQDQHNHHSRCTLKSCPQAFQEVQGVEVAHCFLLGERYSKCFNAAYQSLTGQRLLYMGCYGLGITRLLAVCIEHLTRTSFPEKPVQQINQLRWPVRIAPYSGAIAFQKETAKDALTIHEQKSILDTVQSHPTNMLQMPGDILVDDRKGISLGRKVVDLSRIGIPFIFVAKGQKNGIYEMIDVYKERSCAVTIEQAKTALNNPGTFDSASLPSWSYQQDESIQYEKG